MSSGLVAFAWLCAPAVAGAQHTTGTTVPGAEYEGCNLCHGSHPGDQSEARTLREGDAGAIAASPGLGAASRSCLRCHSSASERMRQPEFAGAPMAAVDGKYLQFDFTDDHPVGQVRRNSILDDGSALGDPTRGLRASALLGRGFEVPGVVECTLCHDPHDRNTIIPGPEQQKILCGSCHELATYAFEGHPSLACGNCHDLHGGHEGNLLAEPTSTALCQSCHDAGGMGASFRIERGVSAVSALPPAPSGHSRPPDGECTSCHDLHE